MKRAIATCGLIALVLLVGARVDAATISFGGTTLTGTCTTNDNTNFNGSQVLAKAVECFGAPTDPLTLLYKQNVGEAFDSGMFSTSYKTTFLNSPLDPQDGTIAYAGGSYMDCLACYLVVKDGNHNPAQYFFNISNWNGIDTIQLTNFWPAQGAISNVAIWGTAVPTPEPASLLLVGTGLGLAALKRRRRAA